MAEVIFKNVSKIYPGNKMPSVRGFNLEIKDKEFIVLVGPSGCGKTTLLRMVAGLEDITEGELYIDGKLVNEIAPKDRDIAMVFQNYALYPHMNVYENMAFGLKLRKFPKSEIDRRVKEAAKILGIEHLLDRKPKALSGGERQRVALGRAIVREPKVFLMDEPLSNLDAKLRVQMRAEIIKLHRKLQTTFIYVTHDQMEAMTMGDRIVVMNKGEIQQIASPSEIYNRPSNIFVAGFIGSPSMNFLNVRILGENDHLFVNFDSIKIKLPIEKSNILKEKGYVNKEMVLGIRPEDIRYNLLQEDSFVANVEVVEHMGSEDFVHVNVNGKVLIVKAKSNDFIKIGDEIRLYFNPDKIHLFDKESQKSVFE